MSDFLHTVNHFNRDTNYFCSLVGKCIEKKIMITNSHEGIFAHSLCYKSYILYAFKYSFVWHNLFLVFNYFWVRIPMLCSHLLFFMPHVHTIFVVCFFSLWCCYCCSICSLYIFLVVKIASGFFRQFFSHLFVSLVVRFTLAYCVCVWNIGLLANEWNSSCLFTSEWIKLWAKYTVYQTNK